MGADRGRGRTGSARRRLARRVAGAVAYGAVLLVGGVVAFEALYRAQLVDTYAPELRAYNPPEALRDDGRPTVLLLGDSFTAGTWTYATPLRALLPEMRVVNSGVSGTGVLQARMMTPKRVARFRPRHLVYQVYVGNDLFDVRYPVNWATLSPARNLYWTTANRVRALSLVNYRMGQWRAAAADSGSSLPSPTAAEPFAVERYTRRPVVYLQAEPTLLAGQILLTGERRADFDRFAEALRDLLAHCRAPECDATVLVVPHCAQVAPRYAQNMRALGAVLPDDELLAQAEYPFLVATREAVGDLPNVRVVSALPALQAAERAGFAVYYENDDHLTPAGHDVVARLLASELLTPPTVTVRR